MVIVASGVTPEGKPCEFYLDANLKVAWDEVKKVVGTKSEKGLDWDYVALVCGLPGTGKSNFSQNGARYCCPWFDESYICFSAEDFIELTNKCKRNSAIILDESFASLNTKVSKSGEFLSIINHLQLIRQKNLYIFLCLPNYFDLAKGVAIYRSHHLFTVYSPEFGKRGSFGAWGREEKKMLYILGQKFMNYHAEPVNFRGRFVKSKCVDEKKYLAKKRAHLLKQEEIPMTTVKSAISRDKVIDWMTHNTKLTQPEIAGIAGISLRTVTNIVARLRGGDLYGKEKHKFD